MSGLSDSVADPSSSSGFFEGSSGSLSSSGQDSLRNMSLSAGFPLQQMKIVRDLKPAKDPKRPTRNLHVTGQALSLDDRTKNSVLLAPTSSEQSAPSGSSTVEEGTEGEEVVDGWVGGLLVGGGSVLTSGMMTSVDGGQE